MDNPTKRKKVTPEVTSIWSPPFFHPPWHSRSARSSYVWPPTLELGIVRGEEEMKRKLLRDALAGEGLQEVTYKMYVVDEDEDVLQTFFVFEATARGFFAARLGQHELNIDYMIMEDVDIRVKNEALKKDVNWVPIVSDVEKDISTEYPLAPALHEGLVKGIEQQVKDIKILALSPLQRTELQKRLSVLRDEKFCNGFVAPEEILSDWEQMVNESLDSNRQEVRNFFESSIQKQIIIKHLFALNEARTAMHSLRALKELTSFLSGANNCGGGDNNLLSRVIDKEVEMELKTLDSLGKGIQQHKSAEATLRGLDRLTDTGAFLAKQQKDLMKHLQEHAATKEEWLNRLLLPSRLDLVFHVRDRPEASGLTNFLSTQAGKVVQEVHKSILADTTPNTRTCAECVICLGELGGALNPPVPPEASGTRERQRGCFLPCMHASACILCCEKVWEKGPQVCPVCKAKLTERPKPLFL